MPVRFHEIVKTNGNGGGDLSDARIAAQIDALNVGYAGTGFTFELAQNTETVQPEWWNLDRRQRRGRAPIPGRRQGGRHEAPPGR